MVANVTSEVWAAVVITLVIVYGFMWITAVALSIFYSFEKRQHRHTGSYATLATIGVPLVGAFGLGVYAFLYPRRFPPVPELYSAPLSELPWFRELILILVVSVGISVPVAFILNIRLLRSEKEEANDA